MLASKLIARAAMKKGFDVRTSETIGMAQRGGSVFGHIRIGDNIFSPLIPSGKADALIAFEPAEAARQFSFLRKEGTVIVCENPVKPYTVSASGAYEAAAMMDFLKSKAARLIAADIRKLPEAQSASGGGIPAVKTLNVFLLGAAVQCGIFPFDADTFKEALHETLPHRILEMNIKAFESGRELCA